MVHIDFRKIFSDGRGRETALGVVKYAENEDGKLSLPSEIDRATTFKVFSLMNHFLDHGNDRKASKEKLLKFHGVQ